MSLMDLIARLRNNAPTSGDCQLAAAHLGRLEGEVARLTERCEQAERQLTAERAARGHFNAAQTQTLMRDTETMAALTERCDAYKEALEKIQQWCDERIAHFSGVLELGHDDYIHGRRAETTVIKREIAALQDKTP